jgi:hypothetical protein
MTPGPTLIMKCSSCDGPMVGLGEMPKGNYYDARSIQESCFSDGIGWVNGEDDE